MVRSLSVMYLHRANRLDAKRLPLMEYGLTDAFRDFCRETFDTQAALDYPPLKLVVANTADGLSRALFTSAGPRGVLTEQGRACCLFVIDDDYLDACVGDQDLRNWLKLFFPAVPKVVLTHPGNPDVSLPARRWIKKEAAVFEFPERHHERLVHLFKSFWMPRFSTALRQYVNVKAGTNWHTPGHNGGRAFAHSPFLRGFHQAFGFFHCNSHTVFTDACRCWCRGKQRPRNGKTIGRTAQLLGFAFWQWGCFHIALSHRVNRRQHLFCRVFRHRDSHLVHYTVTAHVQHKHHKGGNSGCNRHPRP